MAMDGNRLGTAIANAITASVPPANAKITPTQLEAMWQLIGTEIVNEIKINAELVLSGGEIPVPGNGLLDGTSSPVTGSAQNGAATIAGQIQ